MDRNRQQDFDRALASLDRPSLTPAKALIISVARRCLALGIEWNDILAGLRARTKLSEQAMEAMLKDVKPRPSATVIPINGIK